MEGMGGGGRIEEFGGYLRMLAGRMDDVQIYAWRWSVGNRDSARELSVSQPRFSPVGNGSLAKNPRYSHIQACRLPGKAAQRARYPCSHSFGPLFRFTFIRTCSAYHIHHRYNYTSHTFVISPLIIHTDFHHGARSPNRGRNQGHRHGK
jgi:hypothetical protein